MSDGDGESSQDKYKKSEVAGSDEFDRVVAKVVVAQICDSLGFHSSQRSALDTLVELTISYICDLCKSANFYANLAGRTSCSVFDVIQGLEDLRSIQGFSGSSDAHNCLVNSGIIQEVNQFVNRVEEVPFAKPIPSFPVIWIPKATPSFAQSSEVPTAKHIPDWLPNLPDPHTYLHTPVWSERGTDSKAEKVGQAKHRRRAERSLLSLQQRLASNGNFGFGPIQDVGVQKGKQVTDSNPFLAPPLPYGEKEVSEIIAPSESAVGKRVTVLETFAPVIEAAKAGSFDFITSDEGNLSKNKPSVKFKIGLNKKSVAASLFPNSINAKKESWTLRDDERDEKKRRAEMILREAMEKPHDLAQL